MTPGAAGGSRPAAGRAASDDAWAADEARGLFAVADGLGRHPGGGRAAALAARWGVAWAAEALTPDLDEARLRRALARTVQAVARGLAEAVEGGLEPPLRPEAATTLTLLALTPERAALAHVGDTRGYRLRAGRLEQLSRDHSLAWEQHEAGAFDKDAVRTHGNQSLLTRSLAAGSGTVVPEAAVVDRRPGDGFLLCSDGLWRPLGDPRIAELLAGAPDPEAACAALLEAAGAAPQDDVTALVIAT